MIIDGLTVREVSGYFEKKLDEINSKNHPPRVNNNIVIYLTDLVECPIRKALYKIGIEPPVPVDKRVFLKGNMWHSYIEEGYEIKEKALSTNMNGVYARPDAFDLDDEIGVEFKTTDKSYNTISLTVEEESWKDNFLGYLRQILGYMYMRKVNKWRILIIFDRGDYGADRLPKGKTYDITATDELLAKNWKLLMRNKSIIEKILSDPNLPLPLVPQEHMEECKRCPFNSVCPSKITYK